MFMENKKTYQFIVYIFMEYFFQPKVSIPLCKTKYFEVTDTHRNRQTLQLIDFEDCHENVILKSHKKVNRKSWKKSRESNEQFIRKS